MSELFIDSSSIPKTKGVYFVLNPNYKKPEYFQIGTGGHFKGKNPNVSADELKLNWVDNSFVMYIGKAVSETNSAAEAIAEDRIVSIHQPHLRPIIRGKESANTEFGSKIHVPLVSGFTFTDYLSWDAFNEGRYLIFSVEQYKKRLDGPRA